MFLRRCGMSRPHTGNMTLAIARCVAPTGHIHTFEYNALRADAAVSSYLNNLSNILVSRYELHKNIYE